MFTFFYGDRTKIILVPEQYVTYTCMYLLTSNFGRSPLLTAITPKHLDVLEILTDVWVLTKYSVLSISFLVQPSMFNFVHKVCRLFALFRDHMTAIDFLHSCK